MTTWDNMVGSLHWGCQPARSCSSCDLQSVSQIQCQGTGRQLSQGYFPQSTAMWALLAHSVHFLAARNTNPECFSHFLLAGQGRSQSAMAGPGFPLCRMGFLGVSHGFPKVWPPISHIISAFPKAGLIMGDTSSASEKLEQTEPPFFSLGFLAIPAAVAGVWDLLKDTPLFSACLCGSCVTNRPWPSPGVVLQMTKQETEKAQARGEQGNWCWSALDLWGRTKHLCHQPICDHHSVTQNARFGGL